MKVTTNPDAAAAKKPRIRTLQHATPGPDEIWDQFLAMLQQLRDSGGYPVEAQFDFGRPSAGFGHLGDRSTTTIKIRGGHCDGKWLP